MDTSKCWLTLAVCLPRLNDGARNGLPTSGEHAPLNEHMLAYSLRRDRLAEQDCRLNVNGGEDLRGRGIEGSTHDLVHPL